MITQYILQFYILHVLIILGICGCVLEPGGDYNRDHELEIAEFLKEYNTNMTAITRERKLASWETSTNFTEDNKKTVAEVNKRKTIYQEKITRMVEKYDDYHLSECTRKLLNKIGQKNLNAEKMSKLNTLKLDMEAIYGSAQVCLQEQGKEVCHDLEPTLEGVMAKSTNYTLLRYIWTNWREVVGRKARPLYTQFFDLRNELARIRGYTDYGQELYLKYDSQNFEKECLYVYEQIKPLYKLLHAYVRRKLYMVYGPEVIDLKGPLPACVLGDMWGRFWVDLNPLVTPFPDAPAIDVTPAMMEQEYNVTYMYKLGEQFFTSMGLRPLPEAFFKDSLLEKPTDGRKMVCHASAWDMEYGDLRVRMCTKVKYGHLEVVHHELGHIQYDMQYESQPIYYRDSANKGFHEAVGELIAMSMSTPEHLKKIGLLKDLPDREIALNFLLRTALKTISTLPFHLVNDMWLWRAARGVFPESSWNAEFWKMKEDFLGVQAPVERTEEHLDRASIFHVLINYPMINYFTRTIYQFQMAEALCNAAGHVGPLHTCDFYGSKEAGNVLSKMMSYGASRNWKDVLEEMTGYKDMNAGPILQYFQPLEEYMKEYLKSTDDYVGWISSKKDKGSSTEDSTGKSSSVSSGNSLTSTHTGSNFAGTIGVVINQIILSCIVYLGSIIIM